MLPRPQPSVSSLANPQGPGHGARPVQPGPPDPHAPDAPAPPSALAERAIPTEVQEELRLLSTVQKALAAVRRDDWTPDHDAQLTTLRDSLQDERLDEDVASIFEEMDRLSALRAQQRRSATGTVDPTSPYFGHMLVDDDMGRRAVLIGPSTFLTERVRIVDWRNAPISRIFYQYAEGDEYEEEIAGRLVEGEVLVRRTLAIEDSELRRVATDENTWVRTAEDRWRDLKATEARLAGGAGVAIRASSLGTGHAHARRDKHLPEIASLLDKRQFDLITRPDTGVVVVQGSAGSGKTTVGLHRIAYLHFVAPRRFAGRHMAVVVFSKALANYISQVLPALGVDDVGVHVFERWAALQRKRHFPQLPQRHSDETPGLVTRFKTHACLLRLVDEVGAERRGADPAWVFEELLTDRGLLESAVERWAAPGEFSGAQVEKVWRWCSDQHYQRVDGGGPNEHDRPCLDAEDDAILLRLYQRCRGPLKGKRRKSKLRFAHLMVDEAQDLSPLELAVLIGTTGRERSVTLAGDVAQQIAVDRSRRGWTDVMDALELSHVDVSPLQVSYRSTRQIMEVANDILGPQAPSDVPSTTREGAPVAHLAFGGMGEAVAWLKEALTDLMAREPTAYVALLTADLGAAIRWYHHLERAEVPWLTLVDDQEFSFSPGIDVSDIRSSKGLEFDYVVVLDVNASTFDSESQARRLLHVGVTRAAHQVWLVSTDRPSPLVPRGLVGLLGPAEGA